MKWQRVRHDWMTGEKASKTLYYRETSHFTEPRNPGDFMTQSSESCFLSRSVRLQYTPACNYLLDWFKPSYNYLKFMVWNQNYICINIILPWKTETNSVGMDWKVDRLQKTDSSCKILLYQPLIDSWTCSVCWKKLMAFFKTQTLRWLILTEIEALRLDQS